MMLVEIQTALCILSLLGKRRGGMRVACVASVSVGLGSKERPSNGILPARNWDESQNKKEGVGEGKEGNACN